MKFLNRLFFQYVTVQYQPSLYKNLRSKVKKFGVRLIESAGNPQKFKELIKNKFDLFSVFIYSFVNKTPQSFSSGTKKHNISATKKKLEK